VFVNGQGEDVWCDSKIAITDFKMYLSGKPIVPSIANPSCYYAYSVPATPGVLANRVNPSICQINGVAAVTSFFLCTTNLFE